MNTHTHAHLAALAAALAIDTQAIIDAVRRDMRRERELALADKEWAQWHEWNARKDIDLLEALNPKRVCVSEPSPLTDLDQTTQQTLYAAAA